MTTLTKSRSQERKKGSRKNGCGQESDCQGRYGTVRDGAVRSGSVRDGTVRGGTGKKGGRKVANVVNENSCSQVVVDEKKKSKKRKR